MVYFKWQVQNKISGTDTEKVFVYKNPSTSAYTPVSVHLYNLFLIQCIIFLKVCSSFRYLLYDKRDHLTQFAWSHWSHFLAWQPSMRVGSLWQGGGVLPSLATLIVAIVASAQTLIVATVATLHCCHCSNSYCCLGKPSATATVAPTLSPSSSVIFLLCAIGMS